MFPVNLLMIQLFMKVKPRERKMRRKMKDPDETFIASFNASMTDKGSTQETVSAMTVDFDLKKNIQRQLDIDLFRLLYTDALRDRCRVVPNLVTKLLIENLPDRFSWSVAGEALDMNVVLDNQGQFTLAPREKDTGGKEDLALKPNSLPWWFLYVAWTVAISVCLVSSFVVMLYGLKFGYTLSIEWLTLVVVVLLTMIFKKDVEFEDVGADMELVVDGLDHL
ncbi:PKDRE-like protein [Mya arenaria]|uniref:PKDRE-like protein n=1 Tax=Mya arenaria TaxID=6604 RepID=A0ABY7DDX5_MYAAR|nr:PKDRE-like protein [Mya arenaria]